MSDTPNPGGMLIQLTGVATGSAVTAADGSYSVALTASSLGMETATTPDGASATTALTDVNAPLINYFNSNKYQGGYFVFTGHVNGTVFAGEQITFGGNVPGMQGQTTKVNADGSFSFVAHFPSGTEGYVTASATADVWGQNNTAENDFNI
ncbi:MAG TPA: hypothetical protein VGH32_10395 [Pirellulales bacterium]